MGAVENEDYVSALLRLDSGARVVLEASRVAVGEQNTYGFEVHGTTGAAVLGLPPDGGARRQPGGRYQDQPVTTVFVGPGAGHYAAFQPGAGIAMGYDDLKVIEAANFLPSIAAGRPHGADLDDAVRAAVTLDALTSSTAGVLGGRPGARRILRVSGGAGGDLDVHCRPCHISHVTMSEHYDRRSGQGSALLERSCRCPGPAQARRPTVRARPNEETSMRSTRRSLQALAAVTATAVAWPRAAVRGAQNEGVDAGREFTIAMVTHEAPGDTFWDKIRNGAEQAAEDHNIT